MRTYDSKHGYDGGGTKDNKGNDMGARQQMIAKIQDIKASPYAGKKRLVVREEGMNRSHAVIDIDMKDAKDLVRATSRPKRERDDDRLKNLRDKDKEATKKEKPRNSSEGKYVFQVNERDDSKNPGFQRKKSAEFRAFDCHEKPEEYVSGSEHKQVFGRFGGSGNSKNSSRLKF